jgi:hypothetical protein
MFPSVPRRRPVSDVLAVLQLKAAGRTDREVSRPTGVPVNTIRSWRNHGVPGNARREPTADRGCEQCGEAPHDFLALPKATYAYLLGVYLGDGWLSRNGTSWTLSFALDSCYPGIIQECSTAMEYICGRRPNTRPYPGGERCVRVSSTWRPWPCLIPQHGPGPKHQRKIELAPWQEERQLRTGRLLARSNPYRRLAWTQPRSGQGPRVRVSALLVLKSIG